MKDVYRRKEVLGKGSFATVFRAVRKSDKLEVAVKVIKKKGLSLDDSSKVKEEIDIMKATSCHPNIVQMVDVFESLNKIQIVLELCTGGHLLERLARGSHYSEVDAAKIIRQLAAACKHMHAKGVVHRDLKPENILYASPDPNSTIKITDFGLSTIVENAWENVMMTPCGTPAYVAPEVIKRKGYHCTCDMWSVGVILYLLVSGFPPFYGSNMRKLLRRVTRCEYDYRPEPFKNATAGVKEVIDNLLVLDVKKRWTPDQLLTNDWVTGLKASHDNLDNIQERFREIDLTRRFRKGVHLLAALNALRDIALEEKDEDELKKTEI